MTKERVVFLCIITHFYACKYMINEVMNMCDYRYM